MSQNKTYRIRTTANATDESNYLKVKLEQDYDILELLSLKINMSSNSVYRTQSSNYGCIAGRVLGNNSVGIPNAKVSAFVPAEGTDSAVIASVYPYKDTGRRNNNGVRYVSLLVGILMIVYLFLPFEGLDINNLTFVPGIHSYIAIIPIVFIIVVILIIYDLLKYHKYTSSKIQFSVWIMLVITIVILFVQLVFHWKHYLCILW